MQCSERPLFVFSRTSPIQPPPRNHLRTHSTQKQLRALPLQQYYVLIDYPLADTVRTTPHLLPRPRVQPSRRAIQEHGERPPRRDRGHADTKGEDPRVRAHRPLGNSRPARQSGLRWTHEGPGGARGKHIGGPSARPLFTPANR